MLLNKFSSYLSDEYLANTRKRLDYSYHNDYPPERQTNIQNHIIREVFLRSFKNKSDSSESQSSCRWMILTAGVMGSGKSTTIKYLMEKGYIPHSTLTSTIYIDMDEIRSMLPEAPSLKALSPERYVPATQLESGYIAELLIQVALDTKMNMIVDSSMIQCEWYAQYLHGIRTQYSRPSQEGIFYKILLIHIHATEEVIYRRLIHRNRLADRVVPINNQTNMEIHMSITKLNDFTAIYQLFHKVIDYLVSIDNSANIQPDQSDRQEELTVRYPWNFNRELFHSLFAGNVNSTIADRQGPQAELDGSYDPIEAYYARNIDPMPSAGSSAQLEGTEEYHSKELITQASNPSITTASNDILSLGQSLDPFREEIGSLLYSDDISDQQESHQTGSDQSLTTLTNTLHDGHDGLEDDENFTNDSHLDDGWEYDLSLGNTGDSFFWRDGEEVSEEDESLIVVPSLKKDPPINRKLAEALRGLSLKGKSLAETSDATLNTTTETTLTEHTRSDYPDNSPISDSAAVTEPEIEVIQTYSSPKRHNKRPHSSPVTRRTPKNRYKASADSSCNICRLEKVDCPLSAE